jgi:hypothetical protein
MVSRIELALSGQTIVRVGQAWRAGGKRRGVVTEVTNSKAGLGEDRAGHRGGKRRGGRQTPEPGIKHFAFRPTQCARQPGEVHSPREGTSGQAGSAPARLPT